MTPDEFTSEPVSSAIAVASSVSDPCKSGYMPKKINDKIISGHTLSQSVSQSRAPHSAKRLRDKWSGNLGVIAAELKNASITGLEPQKKKKKTSLFPKAWVQF